MVHIPLPRQAATVLREISSLVLPRSTRYLVCSLITPAILQSSTTEACLILPITVYQNIGSSNQLAFGSTVLGGLAVAVTIPIYIFYAYGPQIRARSKFAQVLKGDREASKTEEQSSGEA